MKWSYAGNQQVTRAGTPKFTQSGAAVTAANESYNGTLATGGSVSFGFNGSYSGTNALPATFTLDGVTCNVDGGGGPTDPPGPDGPGPRHRQQGRQPVRRRQGVREPGVVGEGRRRAGRQPDRQPAHRRLAGPHRRHQRTSSGGDGPARPPRRGPAAEGHRRTGRPAGHLRPARTRLRGARLQRRARPDGDRQVQDRSTSTRSRRSSPTPSTRACGSSRSVEIDSLPNLVTNTGSQPTATPACDAMKANGNYVKGVGYALNKLGAIAERLQLHRRRPPRLARLGRQLRPRRRPVQAGGHRRGRDRQRRARLHHQHGELQRPEGDRTSPSTTR